MIFFSPTPKHFFAACMAAIEVGLIDPVFFQ